MAKGIKKYNSSYKPEDIFQTRFWANEKGINAMNSPALRKKAEAIMLFGQSYFPDFFPSNHPTLHTDILALMSSASQLKVVASPTGSC